MPSARPPVVTTLNVIEPDAITPSTVLFIGVVFAVSIFR
jgi:hypothetical protein